MTLGHIYTFWFCNTFQNDTTTPASLTQKAELVQKSPKFNFKTVKRFHVIHRASSCDGREKRHFVVPLMGSLRALVGIFFEIVNVSAL